MVLQSERGVPTAFTKGKDQDEERRKKKHKHRSKDRDKDKDKDKKKDRDKDKKRDKDKDGKDRSKGENGEKKHRKKVLGFYYIFLVLRLVGMVLVFSFISFLHTSI